MGTEKLFHVVFSGSAAAGRDREEVRARLVELFGSPAKVDALFSGGRVLVRRYVSEADAQRYQRAFAAAGAPCELVPVEVAAGPHGDGSGKRTITYGSPAVRARRTTPVYGSPVFADDEAVLADGAEPLTGPPPAEPGRPRSISSAPRAPTASPAPPSTTTRPTPGAVPADTLVSRDAEPKPAGAIPDLDLPPAPRDPPAAAASAAIAAAIVSPAVARHLESPFESAWLVPEPRPGGPAPAGSPRAPGSPDAGAREALAAEALEGDQENGLLSFHRVALAAPLDNAAQTEAGGAALPSLDLQGTSPVDLSLPRLARDPGTGGVVAAPPTRPERPGRFAGPGASRALGQPDPVGAGPRGPAAAVPVLRREFGDETLEAVTPTMLAALERSRLGLTVTAISLFAGAALLACGGFGSLLTLNVLGCAAAVGSGTFCLVGGLRLWSALQALTEAVTGGSATATARSLAEQARFFRLWGILQALSLALGLLALLAGLVAGAAGLFSR